MSTLNIIINENYDDVYINKQKYIKEKQGIVLTEFQKLIVNCEPQINKPVFVLSGAGTGKTFALNERAKKVNFLYVHTNARLFRYNRHTENLNVGLHTDGYEEVVLEGTGIATYILKVFPDIFKKKKVIIFTNGVDFVSDFANKLKGEYTIISGFNLFDNPYIFSDNPEYVDFLEGLNEIDKQRLLFGNFIKEEDEDI